MPFYRGSAGSLDRFVAGDEAGAAGIGEPGPDPVDEDREAIAEADEKVDVDDAPEHPGEPSRELHERQICDRRGPPDRRERTLVAIAKGRGRRRAGDARRNERGDVAALLLR